MASIPIEKSDIEALVVVAPGSRYRNSNVIYYGEKRLLTFETYTRKKYEVTGKENVMVVTKGTEYRPDLVSFDYYGYPDNWWLIMEINSMNDIFQFKAGTTIILPVTEL